MCLPSGNVFGVFAVTSTVSITNFENSTDWATVFTSYSLETDIVFTAIFGVGMTTEWTSVCNLTRVGASETVCYFWETSKYLHHYKLKITTQSLINVKTHNLQKNKDIKKDIQKYYIKKLKDHEINVKIWKWRLTFVPALRDLISPHTHAGFSVVSESRTALIAGSFTIPAVPEDVAFLFVSEDTVKSCTVGGWNWGLCRKDKKSKPIQAQN